MKLPTDEQLDKFEAEVNRYGTIEQTTETFVMLINSLRSAKRQILAYEEALSQIAVSQHVGRAAGRAIARAVLSKEF